MKKFLVAVTVIGIFVAYGLFQKATPMQVSTVSAVVTTPAITTTVPTSKPTGSASPTPTAVATPSTNSGQYKNGVYTGSQADAFYGTVQVQVTVAGGAITDVQFLSYPNDRSTSRMINGMATPVLRSEAISAQNANVNIVSGATDTSMAFIQSLSSALQSAINN